MYSMSTTTYPPIGCLGFCIIGYYTGPDYKILNVVIDSIRLEVLKMYVQFALHCQ